MLYSYTLVCVRVTFDNFELKISDKVRYMHRNTPDFTVFRLHELSKFVYKRVFCLLRVLGSYQLAFVLRLSVSIQVQRLGSRKLFRIGLGLYTLVEVVTLNIFVLWRKLHLSPCLFLFRINLRTQLMTYLDGCIWRIWLVGLRLDSGRPAGHRSQYIVRVIGLHNSWKHWILHKVTEKVPYRCCL